MLESTGEQDEADRAAEELPATVDTEKHADLLSKLSIDPNSLLGDLGGGLPNL